MVAGKYWQSELFHVILKRKLALGQSKWALSSAMFHAAVVVSILYDINQCVLASLFEEHALLIWYSELCAIIIFSLNALYNLWLYLWPNFGQSPLEISPAHQKLFAINESDTGFKLKTPPRSPTSSPELQTPSSRHLHASMMNYSSTPSFLSSTPLNYSADSWAASPGMTSDSNLSITSTSWTYHCGTSPVKNLSSAFSPTKAENNNSFSLRRISNAANLSMSFEKRIKDEQQLEYYLKEFDENEHKSLLMSSGVSSPGGVSNLWSLQHPSNSFISVLRKYQYQPASRSPQSTSVHKDDSATTLTADSVWAKLKVSEDQLNYWIERLRKWLCQTIVIKLVSEIDDINDTLRRLGSPDLQVGEVSLSTLRQIAVTKGQHLPTLSALLPYLDITSNQEYLVHRLRELSRGGCMSEFKWKGGGTYKGKPWGDDLPTDSAVIMHIVCCYMDSRLPPDPHYPDGKTFTSQYFKKTPDKPVISKESLCIYQSGIMPPHYQVIIGEDVWDLPKGRNNLFCAILLFLRHIKTKHCGMLGRVNLGPSGVNILWTVEM